MKKIRIGKEFSVRWGLVLNGLPAELDKMDVKVILVNPFGKRSSLSYTADRNVLVIPIDRNVQPMTGAYSLSLWINKDKDGQTVVDCSPAFCLVASTDEESCTQVQAIKEVLDLGTSEIQLGVQGKSAYQTWLDEGNEGTEEDFLNWLRQPSTEAGTGAQAAAAKATEAAGKAAKAAGAANTAAAEAVRIATTSAAQSEQRVTTAIEGLNQSVSQAEQKVSEAVLSAKQEVSQAVDSANTSVNEAVSKATEATSAAESAAESATASSVKAEASSSKADASKAEADKAAEAARTATQEAHAAKQGADAAAESATASSVKAEASSTKADASKTAADNAAEAARTATQEAHAAKQGADAAAQSATEAAGRAEAAAQSVNTAISNATAATDKANASATKADSSAVKADTAASRATTAAVSAESSSQKAESSSVKADASAKAADAAAATIDNKITDIREEVQNMKNEGNALAGDVSEGKKIVAKAITQKGVLTSPTASYQEMADNIGKISTGQLDAMFRIEIDFTNPSPEVKRFGSAEFPNWLEAATRGVMLKGGKVNYELDRDTFFKKKDKTNSVIDGSDGDIMSQPPVFWVLPTLTASNLTFHMTNIPQTSKGWIKLPAIMYGASRAVREKRSDGKFYLRSCYNTSPDFRGGNNQEKWDDLPGSLLGMPCSQISVSQLREYARNNGVQDSGWYHNWAFMPWFKLMLLFMAIRGTRDWQAAWPGIDPKTGDEYRDEQGFKYGGLGPGVVNFSNYWNKYNGQNPIVRADFCYDMGTRSGVKKLEVNVGSSDAVQIVELQVPCFLGISEPSHGDALLIPDGIRRECLNIDGVLTSRFHIFTNPARFTDSTSVAADLVIDTLNQGSGWVEQVNEWLIPVKVNPRGNSTLHFCDQIEVPSNLGNWGWYMGGYVSVGSLAGGWYAVSSFGLGDAFSSCGGRLCFTPSSDGAENP